MESTIAPFLMILLFIGFFVGIFVIIWQVAKSNMAKINKQFEAIAYNLDAYVTPAKGMFTKPHPVVDGKIKDRDFRLFMYTKGSGKNQVTYTAFTISLNNPTGNTLVLYQEGILSKIGKFFQMQDIQIGDPFFDEKFIIKSNNEQFARNTLQGDLKSYLEHNYSRIKGTFKLENTTNIRYEEVISLNNAIARERFELLLDLGTFLADTIENQPNNRSL